MSKQTVVVLAAAKADTKAARIETLEGIEYRVVPAVILVEGVHVGMDRIRRYYPAAMLEATAAVWQDIPIILRHPQPSGTSLAPLGRDPAVISAQGVGRVYTGKGEDGKQTAEAWLNMARLAVLHAATAAKIEAGEPVELSAGIYPISNQAPAGATWNGEQYDRVVTDLWPDHLALLPDQIGACSIKDGCGVRWNQRGGDMAAGDGVEEGWARRLWRMASDAQAWLRDPNMDQDTRRQRLRDAVTKAIPAGEEAMVEAVYDDKVICRRWTAKNVTTPSALWQYPYTETEDGQIAVDMAAGQEVQEQVTYVPVARQPAEGATAAPALNAASCTCSGCGGCGSKKQTQAAADGAAHRSGDRNMAIKEAVTRLLHRAKAGLGEVDRAWLESIPEEHLARIEMLMTPTPTASMDLPALLQAAAPEVKAAIETALAAEKARHTELAEQVSLACNRRVAAADLAALSRDELSRISIAVGSGSTSKHDYSGAAGGGSGGATVPILGVPTMAAQLAAK